MDRLISISGGMTKTSDDQWIRILKRKQTKNNLHTYVYLVLSVRQAKETLVNSSRRKIKLLVHVFLVLSAR